MDISSKDSSESMDNVTLRRGNSGAAAMEFKNSPGNSVAYVVGLGSDDVSESPFSDGISANSMT